MKSLILRVAMRVFSGEQVAAGVRLLKILQSAVNALRNQIIISVSNKNFEVLEFRWIDRSDPSALKWNWWSRIYEYELVLNALRVLGAEHTSRVHNTCWGYQKTHIDFKLLLENSYTVVNSDLQVSHLQNTEVWDITKKPRSEWKENFDFCINVSSIEEVYYFPHLKIIQNLMSQIKIGGSLIITFDYPGIQLRFLERYLGMRIASGDSPISGINSDLPMKDYDALKVGLLVLKKTG